MTAHRVEISPRTIGLVLLAVAAVWLAQQLMSVLTVVAVALILVGTIDPLVAWLEHRGLRRGRALAAVFFLLTLIAGVLLMLMVPAVVAQVFELTIAAPAGRDRLVEWLSQYKSAASVVASVKALPVDDLMAHAGSAVLGYSTTILTTVGYAVTAMFLAIYLLAEPARSKGMLYAVVSRHHHIKLARILLELKVIVGGYMRGQLITSVSIAVFVFVLLTALGIDNALALALFAGFTDLIPFVGGLIASAPVIAASASGGAGQVILVAILMFVYQEFESRILVPRVYGGVLRLSSAVVVVSLLIGGTLMGMLGALLALPVAAGMLMLVRELRVELPGEEPATATARAADHEQEQIYEQMTVGATAAEAGVIAGELAEHAKETEQRALDDVVADEDGSAAAAASIQPLVAPPS